MENLITKVLNFLKAYGTSDNNMLNLTRFVFFSLVNGKHTDQPQKFGRLLWDIDDCNDEKEEADDLAER